MLFRSTMPVLELELKSGVMAAGYLLLLYGMAFSVIIFSDYYWQLKVLVTFVLIAAAAREAWQLFLSASALRHSFCCSTVVTINQ